jgi:hypothetical protein
MKLIQQDNFFPNLNLILPEVKKIKLYNLEQFHKLHHGKGNWPGYRSLPINQTNPSLYLYINHLMREKKLIPKGKYSISTFLHLRLKEDDKKDWIHKDDDDFAGLIYLSNSNPHSGTYLYDENKNIINDIKFVQNRFVMYDGSYNHMGYGHHGSSIKDGRLTLNLFIKRIS